MAETPYQPLASAPDLVRLGRWIEPFLATLAETGSPHKAAEAAHVSLITVRRRKARFPDFKLSYNMAMQKAGDALEQEARRRALIGWEEPVFGSLGNGQGTGQVGTIRRYSDSLLMLLLRGAMPKKYHPKQAGTNINVSANATINSAEEIEKQRKLMEMVMSDPEALEAMGVLVDKLQQFDEQVDVPRAMKMLTDGK